MTRIENRKLEAVEGGIEGTLELDVTCDRCEAEFELAKNGSNFPVFETWMQFEYLSSHASMGTPDLCPKCALAHMKFMGGAELAV